MTMALNLELPLEVRRVPAGERHKRIGETLELVGLAGLGDRYANRLSGGQQQRVALPARSATTRACCCSTSSSRTWTPSCATGAGRRTGHRFGSLQDRRSHPIRRRRAHAAVADVPSGDRPPNGDVYVSIRPEDIVLHCARPPELPNVLPGRITFSSYLGNLVEHGVLLVSTRDGGRGQLNAGDGAACCWGARAGPAWPYPPDRQE
jgi:ABC-type Fe3+/spermidine/putrescine transport system ATPase subunit